MERCGKERPRRGREYPSFSSTLLDVIYRSIDESDAGGEPDPSPAVAQRRPIPPSKERTTLIRPRVLLPISTSSSSDNSSYGGFSSSSEPDSAASRRARIRQIRTLPPPSRSTAAISACPHPPPPPPLPRPTKRAPSPPAKHHRERTRSSSIRNKLRDLGRPKTPASPGSRLASLLNSLFANAAGKQRKPKPSPPIVVDDSPCSAASTRSRPCLVKTPSSRRGPASDDEGFKRSVRFHPVSVVMGEEILPRDQKIVYAGDPAAAARLDDRRWPTTVADGKAREDARRKVAEMLRSLEVEEEEEDEMSDSSSDLFELENLTVRAGGVGVGGGGGGRYRDELPVYETTHPGNNRAFLAASSNKNY
ncbi:protein BIG GRAIN 1-like [Curcuma longa]|uniref:protein BIG GRAIN 1-like n=1 Tax=Curcuma longa TaxID=136217 RepID=UPI003D9E5F20